MIKYFKAILNCSLVFIYACASIDSPSGGPRDISAPKIINIIPDNESTNILDSQQLILVFDEMIDPNSIVNSIEVMPPIDIKTRVINNKIYINPHKSWPKGSFQVSLLRAISDYNANMLDKQISLLFSTDSLLVYKNISGKLYNIKENSNYEIALINEKFKILNKVESDAYGNFELNNFVDTSSTLLVAIENKFSDNIFEDIKDFRYGISNNLNTFNQDIYISEPIWEPKVFKMDFINNHFGKIIFDNQQEIYYISDYKDLKEISVKSEDFIYIDSKIENDFNISFEFHNSINNYIVNYNIQNYINVMDSIAPYIESRSFINNNMKINFSEPVIIKDNSNPFYFDNKFNFFEYKLASPKEIILYNVGNDVININCLDIFDLNKLALCDSTIIIGGNLTNDNRNNDVGSLDIGVNYFGAFDLVLKLKNQSTQEVLLYEINGGEIMIDNLIVGDYDIELYENKNKINLNYFSGTLEPFSLAANFHVYSKVVTVRKNWINNILIDFNI